MKEFETITSSVNQSSTGIYEKWIPGQARNDSAFLRLYAVTDRQWSGSEDNFFAQVDAALQGGVTCLQLREKTLAANDFIKLGKKIKSLCNQYNIPLVINDNIEVALAVGADGVHLGQNDIWGLTPFEHKRTNSDNWGLTPFETPSDFIIGISVSTTEQAKVAVELGASYLGVGAIFPTQTKTDIGIVPSDVLRDIKEASHLPIVAIGGINARNISELRGLPINGVAVVSAIFARTHPVDVKATTAKLRTLVDNIIL